ncbi:hypothetical protein MUN89_08560 [Halobacillus salinarum]|uniref:Uncharacterized protein n=1 Tax=Halobacillus salinarum TaxID=2932257 RepID=A0ABY4EP79_9BACI|nr:hypothetical protein [Halobacillus salinarum]UOQ45958.1 hypothetical protein MUN89_08560 [Halobacillus salinarum]
MIVRDEFNQSNRLEVSPKKFIKVLQKLRNQKEQTIEEIRSKISKYEEKKNAEQAFYQSLSPVRKFFASRPPSHHQAVEYMVHVKERLKQIDFISQSISELDTTLEGIDEGEEQQELILSSSLIDEIREYKETGDL